MKIGRANALFKYSRSKSKRWWQGGRYEFEIGVAKNFPIRTFLRHWDRRPEGWMARRPDGQKTG